MSLIVTALRDIDKSRTGEFGGKAANLGELTRIGGICVPEGFCISTEAFKRIMGESATVDGLLDKLSLVKGEDREKIRELSGEIRRVVEALQIPRDIEEEVSHFVSEFGEKSPFAVRSSSTAEDLPMASFAGQQDTYLNIIGKKAILEYISKCWASLFTERAVIYRLQNGYDNRKVHLAVVVQKMIFPQAAGILFTADPVTSNRKVLSIDASFGLGEAVALGLVNTDIYKVNGGKVTDKKISTKKLAISAKKDGGTLEEEIVPEKQNQQVLAEAQILQLAQMGRQIEEHFGTPQDIEWCFADGTFYIVQSRPITTLYPIPEQPDEENHLYISVGHQQMMTDPMKPLGLSLWQITAFRPMFKAGGRLFVDVTRQLASPASRETLIQVMGQHDPLIKDALDTIIERGEFIKPLPDETKDQDPGKNQKTVPPPNSHASIEIGPALVSDLIKSSQTSLEALMHHIQAKSGPDLFDFILEDIQQLKKRLSDSKNMAVIMAAINASSWINEKIWEWLGEKNVADTLSQSAPNNITSQMGLDLLDVADVIRPFPELIYFLQHVKDDTFLSGLDKFKGGKEARKAISGFLDKYGMRCAGEIDITRTRWSEKPSTLVPLILSNIKNLEPHASARKFKLGLREAMKKEKELLDRLEQLPDGKQKAMETKRVTRLLRNLIGYREYPKYDIVNRLFIYKQALLKEAEKLAQANIINEKEDIYYLSFEEFREVVRTKKLDHQLISDRKTEFRFFEKLSPPRVIQSDGEIIHGKYKRENLPSGAMPGLAVSSGVIEGRARVILKMEDAKIEDGDILVTCFTDPSWTPLFVSIKGLVAEVGGLMTHGAVIAREYGIPAVVGVENATKLIRDGQRIRVDGTEGYVEIL